MFESGLSIYLVLATAANVVSAIKPFNFELAHQTDRINERIHYHIIAYTKMTCTLIFANALYLIHYKIVTEDYDAKGGYNIWLASAADFI